MSQETKNILTFHYDSGDFVFHVSNTDNVASEFDNLLCKKWEEAEKNGIFRYPLNIIEWKRLEGKYKFLAQLNINRAQNRREPQNITSMSTEFDSNLFNFTKINEQEIMFSVSDADDEDIIAVNISPFEYGHCLFIPNRLKCLTQKVTESSLMKIVELFLLSKSPYLRAVFNSLCAYASVNHLHWHFYYLKHEMLLQNITLETLAGPLYVLKDYPAKGFCIKLSSFLDKDIYSFASWAFLVINYLQNHSIAHNVYITRAKCSPDDDSSYDDMRIYIWARKSAVGIKNTATFFPAVCEFFGHLSIKTEDCYENITENDVVESLVDATAETFDRVKEQLKKLIDDRVN